MTHPTLYIIADWDETITSHDTLSLTAPPDSSEPNRPPPFSYFTEYYLSLMNAHEKAFGSRDTLDRQLEYIASLTPVEKATVKKVEEKGLFKGVREEDIRKRAQQVEFRDGWKDFTELVTKREHVQLIGILSANWSAKFIEAALRRIHDDVFMEKFEIRANNIEMDSEGKGTGIISKMDGSGICTGYDKLREMKKLIAELATPDSFIMVYVGDSIIDLPCLLHADIGIIMGNGSSLIETCKRVGVIVESGQSLRKIDPQGKGVTSLYHFNDWYDIISSGLLE